jgi:hypothetical protein
MKKVALLTLIFSCFSFLTQAQSTKKDYKQLLKTFAGRYTSVVANGTADEKKLIDQMTITIVRVKGSFFKDPTFYVKYVRGDGSLYRQRLYTFQFDGQKIQSQSIGFVKDSLFVDFYKNSEKTKNLTQNDLKSGLNCPDTWVKTDEGFVGSMDNCPFKSERRGGKEIYISSKMLLTKTNLSTTEAGKDETGKILFGKIDGYALVLNRLK